MPEDEINQNTIVTHAVLTGLTPLIPIPFVDDQVYSYFLRSMVQQLAVGRGVTLTPGMVQALTTQQKSGCPLGGAGSLLLYPVKKVFRKIFFLLEWKRAADIISHTYYFGYLLDVALQENQFPAHSVLELREAIDRVLARTNTSVINRAATMVVNSSKDALKSAGMLLGKQLPPGATNDAKAGDQGSTADYQEKPQVGNVISQLQAAIADLPSEHFARLREELKCELEAAKKNATTV